jgi:hypothetical protein
MDSLPFSIDWDQRDVLTIFIGQQQMVVVQRSE